MTVKPDIVEKENCYIIAGRGPWIHKRQGIGKILAELLDWPESYFSLDEIESITGWKNPIEQMRELSHRINHHSRYYHLQTEGRGKDRQYKMVEMFRGRERNDN